MSPTEDGQLSADSADSTNSDKVHADVLDIDLDDSAELTQENLRALLDRAKLAGRDAACEARKAFDAIKSLADTGMLRTTQFKKNGNGASI